MLKYAFDQVCGRRTPAVLKNRPLRLALVDMTWGTLVSAISAAAGKFVYDRPA